MTKDDLFFIRIQDPKGVRRTLIEASQQMVEGMKSYEKYKKLKTLKLQKLAVLKKQTLEIKQLAGQLRACLPTIKGRPDTTREKAMSHVAEIEIEQLTKQIRQLEEELHLVK